jgi:hypothetical protein
MLLTITSELLVADVKDVLTSDNLVDDDGTACGGTGKS